MVLFVDKQLAPEWNGEKLTECTRHAAPWWMWRMSYYCTKLVTVRLGHGLQLLYLSQCSKSVSRERTSHKCLAPMHHRRRHRLNIQHVWEMRDRAKPWRWIGDRDTGKLSNGGGERR
jgi:hypothetical protein